MMEKWGGKLGGEGGVTPLHWKRMLILAVVVAAAALFGLTGNVEGNSIQCVQLGQTYTDDHGLEDGDNARNREVHDKGPYTLGTETFQTYNVSALKLSGHNLRYASSETTCDAQPFGFVNTSWKLGRLGSNLCPKEVQMRIYLVRQNGRTLKGWLHVEVEMAPTTAARMKYVYLQARDENFNVIGEFVKNEVDQCKPSREYLLKPTKYQYYPCAATGAREAQTAEALFVADPPEYVKNKDNSLVNQGLISSQRLTRGISFTWRLNEYWCSRHRRFRFDAFVYTNNSVNMFINSTEEFKNHRCITTGESNDEKAKYLFNVCGVQRKVSNWWIFPLWIGASDIKTPDAELDCSVIAIDDKTGVVDDRASNWISNTKLQLKVENDYIADGNQLNDTSSFLKYKVCNVDPFVKDPATFPKFSGRCKYLQSQANVSRTQYQLCNMDANAPEFEGIDTKMFTSYKTYKSSLSVSRLEACKRQCRLPTSMEDFKTIEKYPEHPSVTVKNNTEKKPGRISLDALQAAGDQDKKRHAFQTRKFHGGMHLIITLFLLPCSIFLSRYYKETCMSTRWLGCAPWFWLHIGTTVPVLSLGLCGYVAVRTNFDNWGKSTSDAAKLHSTLGYGVAFIFFFINSTGFLRPVCIIPRIVVSALHSILGFIVYFGSIVIIILSEGIPGSPSATNCIVKKKGFNNTNDKRGNNEDIPETSIAIYVTMLWVGIDILFHILMTIIQCMLDKRERVKRAGFGLPFFPFLPIEYSRDFIGSAFRKLVLIIYVPTSFLFAVYAAFFGMVNSSDIIENEKEGKGDYCELGNLSCNITMNPFGCSRVSNLYYNDVVKPKYNITNETVYDIS